MRRFFFDFDDIPDEHGVLMASMNEAYNEALRAMPEYALDLLSRDRIKPEMTCTIHEAGSPASYKIVLSMRVEDANGAMIAAPFLLDV